MRHALHENIFSHHNMCVNNRSFDVVDLSDVTNNTPLSIILSQWSILPHWSILHPWSILSHWSILPHWPIPPHWSILPHRSVLSRHICQLCMLICEKYFRKIYWLVPFVRLCPFMCLSQSPNGRQKFASTFTGDKTWHRDGIKLI